LDVRVIATTNRNLAEYVEEGNFREDLFYRLQVITVLVPPLREHREDILPLSEFFVRRHCRVNRRPRKRLSQALREHLLNQNWRGNVRELENFLERAVLLCQGDEITPEGIFLSAYPQPLALAASRMGVVAAPFPERVEGGLGPCVAASGESTESSFPRPGELMTLEEMERRMIMQTLEQVGGNRTRAADLLGVSVRTIRNKLNLYGIASGSPEKEKAAVGA
jgi:two-component system response regulator FlrC